MTNRVTVLGLGRGEDLYDGILEGDRLVLSRVGRRQRRPATGLGPLLLLLTWAAAVSTRIGARRLGGATGHGLAGDDESLSRERLRQASVDLRELARRHPSNVSVLTAGLRVRAIAGDDAPLVELSAGGLRQPILLEAVGDPPQRLLRALKERGAIVDGA